ncbi:MAG: peptidoglycan DD-metalloendopeptidase family protein [Turicibacter sp.]|nr:peptidoglycan DD-metalloendopeptidase family protein [Turicibacter sp.]
MLKMQNPKDIRRLVTRTPVRTNSHAQKKYFSLMLVPSYSSGRTRSIRIPYLTFYVLFAVILITGGVMAGLHFRAENLRQTAEHAELALEEIQEAFIDLQETAEEERRQLIEDSINLRSTLAQERMRGEDEQLQQRATYLETLEILQFHVEELEEQIWQFETRRQQILDALSLNSHIPIVRTALNELHQSQLHSLVTLEDLRQYSQVQRERRTTTLVLLSTAGLTESTDAATYQFFDLIATAEFALEIMAELDEQLMTEVERLLPHISNHPTIRPVNGRFTSGFGWRRNPFGSGSEFHSGVDIAAPRGTAIVATGGGRVTFAGWNGAYGNQVVINHGNGIQTSYAHASSILVRVGQYVSRGEVIARVGSTGRSTGPHVHYEVLINGRAVNPVTFFLD